MPLTPDAAERFIAPDYNPRRQIAHCGIEPLRELLRRIPRENPQSAYDLKRIYDMENASFVEHSNVAQDVDPDCVNIAVLLKEKTDALRQQVRSGNRRQ